MIIITGGKPGYDKAGSLLKGRILTFEFDRVSELGDLPRDENIGAGSKAYCRENEEIYHLNGETRTWEVF